MTTQEQKIAIVQAGVDEFAKVEQALEQAVNGLRALEAVYRRGADADMLTAGQAHKTVNAFRKLSGRCGEVAEAVYELHERGTAIAKKNDADVAVPTGYVVPMGGGGR